MSRERDRRRTPRWCTWREHGVSAVRVRPGHAVQLVNLSAGGVLVESDHRLMPGATVTVQFDRDGARVVVRGNVIRCAVCRLDAGGVWYRGAIRFEHPVAARVVPAGPEDHRDTPDASAPEGAGIAYPSVAPS